LTFGCPPGFAGAVALESRLGALLLVDRTAWDREDFLVAAGLAGSESSFRARELMQ
jgi:hypothetical protein